MTSAGSGRPTSFTDVAEFYDELMRGVPYRSWLRYIEQSLLRRKMIPRAVLDLACGTGAMAELMARKRWPVIGVDLSADMISHARAKARAAGLPIEYLVQDAARLDLGGRTVDLCVSVFDSLNYVTDPAALQQAFHRVLAHLLPGGLFLFDLNSEYALRNAFFDQDNTSTAERLQYRWRSEYDPETRLCTVNMRFQYLDGDGTLRPFVETHTQRAHGHEEVLGMLEQAGFVGIEAYHAYTFRPVRATSDRISYVACAPEDPDGEGEEE